MKEGMLPNDPNNHDGGQMEDRICTMESQSD